MPPLKTIGVIGCGLMGSGIAQISAQAGFKTVVREVNDEFLKKGLGKIEDFLNKGVEKGKVKPEDRPVASQIAARLGQMTQAPGVDSVEQCSVAIRQQGTKAESVLPHIKVVGNSWISLMSYQARGYAYIRP